MRYNSNKGEITQIQVKNAKVKCEITQIKAKKRESQMRNTQIKAKNAKVKCEVTRIKAK